MAPTERFGVSMPEDLLHEFDRAIEDAGYVNRSEAFRDIARDYLTRRRWELPDGEVVGTITLVYDHHVPGVEQGLTEVQHDAEATVVCNTHVHLDHHNCVEVIVVRGPGSAIRKLADRMIAMRGVKHGELSCTAAG
ncbi:MAG TPA: nickel-responsive transcriptional regulator NikR [Armatimonadetes bacterium]|nr:nickel-responsive transcriptional regulator NikR [Armatimonadota bacterium]